jgi:hypothetical protein
MWIVIIGVVVLAMYLTTYLRIADISNHVRELTGLAEEAAQKRRAMLQALERMTGNSEADMNRQ